MIKRALWALVKRTLRLDLAAVAAAADETVAALEAGEIDGWGF